MENRRNTRLSGDCLTVAGRLTPQVGYNKLVGNSMQYYKIVGNSGSQGEVAPQPIDGWETFLREGQGYLRTAVNAHQKQKRVFTAEILYNMVAMAIEKFFMAALMRHGTMPMNHTMVDMMIAMEQTFPHAVTEIREAVIALDTYQQICDPWTYTMDPPEMAEIPSMLQLAEQIHVLVANELLAQSA